MYTTTTSSFHLEMDSFLLLFLLLTSAFALKDTPKTSSSCSSNFFEYKQQLYELEGNTSNVLLLPLHPAHGPCSPTKAPLLSTSSILSRDRHRLHHLLARLSPLTHPSAISVPVTPGTSLGVGNYVAKIGLGTPPVDYIMVVDTGSSLTWVQCSPCRVSCYEQQGPVFDPKGSTTYASVSCSMPECKGLQAATLNPSTCSRSNVCIYQASYGDSSFSVGYLGRDALSFGSTKMLPNFVYGCGQDNEGLFGKAAGLIGLAKDQLSMLGQIATKYGNSFSYCLPSTSSAGYLSIGSYTPAKYTFTPMVPNSLDKSLYFIKLTSITVAGKSISVSPTTYSNSPTIIDSGTVITRLPADVYAALSKAVLASMPKSARAPAYSILETCFKGSFKGLRVPPVSLVFAGGAEMKLSPQNVFYDLTSNGITCLAFATSSSVTIIGNHQQETFNVAYDVAGGRVGFAAGGCR